MGDLIHIEPCPWCGASEASANATCQTFMHIEPRAIEGELTVNMDGFGWYWVICDKCHAEGPKYHGKMFRSGNTGPKNFNRDKDKTAIAIKTAVEAWNVRAREQMELFGINNAGTGVFIEPCPFCGESELCTDRSFDAEIWPISPEGALSMCCNSLGEYWTLCAECGAQGPKSFGKHWSFLSVYNDDYQKHSAGRINETLKALDLWNRRFEK